MDNNKTLTTALGWLLLTPALALANEAPVSDGGLDIATGIRQEKHSQGTLTVSKAALQPWFAHGAWNLYGELPFEQRSSDFQGTVTRTGSTRSGLLGLMPARQTQSTVTVRKGERVQGVADASLGVAYALPLPSERLRASLALDYKFDNGDVAKGLGSGTRDVGLTGLLTYSIDRLELNGTLGRVRIEDTQVDASADVTTWGAGARYSFTDSLSLGVSYNDQSSPYAGAPDQGVARVSGRWRVGDALALEVAYGRYQADGEQGQPESEVGLGANFYF